MSRIELSEGGFFHKRLYESITPNENIGGDFYFIKWMKNGGLQFKINDKQKKSIPPEIIIMAYHIHKRNKKIKSKIDINRDWLKVNGYSEWCFIEVLKYLVDAYKMS
jgi:hypothetical protein